MTGEIDIRAMIPADSEEMRVGDLGREYLGRQVALYTGAALYVGELTRISHFPNVVFLKVKRGDFEAGIDMLPPGTVIWVRPQM